MRAVNNSLFNSLEYITICMLCVWCQEFADYFYLYSLEYIRICMLNVSCQEYFYFYSLGYIRICMLYVWCQEFANYFYISDSFNFIFRKVLLKH